jgi:DNA-binding NtrC family response regulator
METSHVELVQPGTHGKDPEMRMDANVLKQLQGCTVLLIEDSEIVLRALHTAFDFSGCRVTSVATAEEGLSLVRQMHFDIIVSDCCLPGMDGIRFFSLAKPYTHRCAKVLMSAYGFGDLIYSAEQAGVHALFEKPFSIQKLLNRIVLIRRMADKLPAGIFDGPALHMN